MNGIDSILAITKGRKPLLKPWANFSLPRTRQSRKARTVAPAASAPVSYSEVWLVQQSVTYSQRYKP